MIIISPNKLSRKDPVSTANFNKTNEMMNVIMEKIKEFVVLLIFLSETITCAGFTEAFCFVTDFF